MAVEEHKLRKRICLVVQRYGAEITGGAELHCRWVVEQLKPHFDLTVYTTTAEDYITWSEVFPPGEEEIDGVRVIRFPVQEQRDLQRFNAYSEWIYHERHRDIDEERWLRMQGPYCPELIEAIKRNRTKFDLFFFFTYLYYTTVKGIAEAGNRAVLLPTAHDEPAIRLTLFKDVFAAPSGFLLNTHEERRFLEHLFDFGTRPRAIVGMGIDWPEPPPDPTPTLKKYGLDKSLCISSGRISSGKGYDRIFRLMPKIKSEIDIVLFGKLELELPNDPRVKYIGFVSEEEKWHLTRAAEFSIQPSLFESLSLTLLESMSMGVPVMINRGCAVLYEHVRQSGGGVYYHDEKDFPEVFDKFVADEALRREMGERGRAYARKNYETRAVARKYVDFLNKVIAMRERRPVSL